jgi:hypothetical protein
MQKLKKTFNWMINIRHISNSSSAKSMLRSEAMVSELHERMPENLFLS